MTGEREDAAAGTVARINGVALHPPGAPPPEAELRQRAHTELLRQAAQREGLLDADDAPADDGIVSERASAAIEALIERAAAVAEPSEEACRRYFEAHAASYRRGERVHARHILFAVTPGVDVAKLRQRAEQALLDVRCFDGERSLRFAAVAAELSNCPSGAHGGELGWLTSSDCAPEFAAELFGRAEVGVLPRLVHSRFGLHVVEVIAREPGEDETFEAVHGAVAMALRQQSFVVGVRRFLCGLAAEARLDGVDLDGAGSPLVQ